MKVVYVNVEGLQPQNTSVKLVLTQTLEKKTLTYRQVLNVKLCLVKRRLATYSNWTLLTILCFSDYRLYFAPILITICLR